MTDNKVTIRLSFPLGHFTGREGGDLLQVPETGTDARNKYMDGVIMNVIGKLQEEEILAPNSKQFAHK